MEYAPFAIVNYTVPIISVIFGYVGFKIIKLKEIDKEDSDNANLA